MKIGLVLDDTLDKPDGVQAAVLDIGAEFSKRGHEVHYLVTKTIRKDIKNIHSMSGYFSLKFNGNSVRTPKPASRKKIRKLLEELELDVLHVQMPYSPLMAGRVVACAPKSCKVFGTFHILPYDKKTSIGTKILGVILKNNLKKFNKFFAVSIPAQKFMKSTFSVDSLVVPNPVNYQFYSSFQRKNNKKIQLVFVGRFEMRKGVKQLLEAYHLLPKELRTRTKLTMCGKGPLLATMKRYAQEEMLHVDFPGFVTEEDKAQYLTNADIAVFPSISGESFGIVLAEAMSAKAGVTLGGDNPGYRSVLKDFPKTLFNPTNTAQFSKTLRMFITDSKLRESIGKRQHQYVKNFDIEHVATTLLREYSK